MKFHVRKVSATLLSVEPDGAEFVAGLKVGDVLGVEAKRARNYRMLRKYFALINLAYDYWEPGEGEYKGQTIEKNLDKFRHDVQCIAGYGMPVWSANGDLRVVSKSISFGAMKQEEFDQLYNKVLDVLMRMVLTDKGFTREAANMLIDQLAEFA